MKLKLLVKMAFGEMRFGWPGFDEEFHSAKKAIEWAEENELDVETTERDTSNDEALDACISDRHPYLSVEEVIHIRENLKFTVKVRNN